MAASLLYDGEISAATMVTACAGNTGLAVIPYSNGQRVIIIKLLA